MPKKPTTTTKSSRKKAALILATIDATIQETLPDEAHGAAREILQGLAITMKETVEAAGRTGIPEDTPYAFLSPLGLGRGTFNLLVAALVAEEKLAWQGIHLLVPAQKSHKQPKSFA